MVRKLEVKLAGELARREIHLRGGCPCSASTNLMIGREVACFERLDRGGFGFDSNRVCEKGIYLDGRKEEAKGRRSVIRKSQTYKPLLLFHHFRCFSKQFGPC